MEITEVDGVPVAWQQGPAPLRAGLLFRVGRRDEGFADGGLTHLVEHLVMASLPKSRVDRNASVSTGTTEFTVTGRPEQVAEFFDRVCAALRDLPLDRLATERRVLAAEEASSGASSVGSLLSTRYGARGLGLSGMVEPAVEQLSEQQVREHAAHYFCRGNAALWLTGPVPPGLRLDLPEGDHVPAPPQSRLPLPLPGQQRYPGPDVAMSVELPVSELTLVAGRLARERMEDVLRHDGGHSYDVALVPSRVDARWAHVALVADAAPREVEQVARGMWAVLQDLAADGPTEQELADDVEGAREVLDDPRVVADEAAEAAVALLQRERYVPVEERLEELAAVTRDDVASAWRDALSSLLVLVPEDAPAVLPEVPALPELSTDRVEGRRHKRRLRSDAPRGSHLVVGAEGVTVQLGPARRVTVRFDACVAVGVGTSGHRHLELVGVDGFTVPVCEQDWRDGARVLDEVEPAVHDVPHYELPAEDGRG